MMMMKIFTISTLLLFSFPLFAQYAGGEHIKADTVSIYRVGRIIDGKNAYHVSWGQKSRVFKSFTITDATGERKFFKSALNAVEYLKGELIDISVKKTGIGPKPVFRVNLKNK